MAKVYNNKSKVWEDVEDASLPSAISSGSHSFPAGMTIPMMDDKGAPIDVPSENAGRAFGFGFTLSTPAASSAAYDRQSADVLKQKMAQIPATAFGMNAINTASFGTMDAAGRLIGGEDYAKNRNALNEANPIASTLGTVAGVAGSLAAGPVGVLGRGAGRIGGAAAEMATEALAPVAGSGRIGAAMSNLASKTVGAAAENAFFGLGTGLSEAALGKPEDVVDHILSGVTMGGMIGGGGSLAFGAANVAKSAFQKLATSTIDRASDVVSGLAQKAGRTALKTALNARGETALAEEAANIINPGAMEAIQSPEVAAGMQDLKGAGAAEASLNTQLKNQSTSIKDSIAAEAKDVQDEINTRLVAAQGDSLAAMDSFKSSYIEANDQLNSYLANDLANKPAVMADPARDLMKSTVDKLKEIAVTAEEKRFVNEFYDTADKQFGMRSRYLDGIPVKDMTMADEITGAKTVREYVGNKSNFTPGSSLMRNSSNEFRELVKTEFMPKMQDIFEVAYPDKYAAKALEDLRVFKSAESALGSALGKSGKGITNIGPLLETKAGQVLGSIEDLLPDLEKARLAAGNAAKLEQTYETAFIKLNRLKADRREFGHPLSYDDFRAIMSELTPPKSILDKMDRLKATQDALNTGSLSQIDAAIQMKRALGQDVSNLEKLQPHYKMMDTLSKIQDLKQDGSNWIANKVPGLASASRAFNDPARIIRSVQGIQAIANSGAKALDKSIKYATDALLGKKIEMAVIKGSIVESAEKRRSRYDAARTKLAELQNPQRLQDHIASSTGGLEGAPMIKSAIASKLAQGVSYLAQQAPQDPMAGTSILAHKTNFTPSDAMVSKFMRQVDAVGNPLGVIARVASGRVSQDEIQALKAVHPALYNKLQAAVINGIMEHGEKIPYERRLQIGQLFNTPTDYSMQPQFVGAMQQNFADKGGRPQDSKDSEKRDYSGRKPKLDTEQALNSTQTTSDSLTYKGQGKT